MDKLIRLGKVVGEALERRHDRKGIAMMDYFLVNREIPPIDRCRKIWNVA